MIETKKTSSLDENDKDNQSKIMRNNVLMAILLMAILLFGFCMILLVIRIIQSFLGINNISFYVILFFLCTGIGIFVAFSFLKRGRKLRDLSIIFGSLFSVVLSILFATNVMIEKIIFSMNESLNELYADETLVGVQEMFGDEIINMNIGFAIAFLCFNIPIVFFYIKHGGKNFKLFLLYLVPIFLFLLFSFLFRSYVLLFMSGI